MARLISARTAIAKAVVPDLSIYAKIADLAAYAKSVDLTAVSTRVSTNAANIADILLDLGAIEKINADLSAKGYLTAAVML